MKLAIITDLHMDPANPGRLDLVDRFIARATEEDASVVIDLGDRLTDTSKAADLQQLQAISGAFARYHGPRIHLIGNHDIVNLDADEQARILGVPMTNRILEFEHVRLVVWQGSPSLTDQGFIASEEQVDWLAAQLRYDDDRPAIVLSHIPIAENSQIGNFWFQSEPDFACYANSARLRDIVLQSGQVSLWLAGHQHWNTFSNIGNVRHVTIQSASETFTTGGTSGAYAILTIEEDARLQVFGKDPFDVKWRFEASARHPWRLPRLPS